MGTKKRFIVAIEAATVHPVYHKYNESWSKHVTCTSSLHQFTAVFAKFIP